MQRLALHAPKASGSSEHREAGPVTPSIRSRVQMLPALRLATLAAGALLWLSGVLWLVLHYAFAQQTPFGPLPNPSEPLVMQIHGWLAVCGVFLLGWIAGGHVVERWQSGRWRLSGLLLAAAAVVLVVTGYALYYTTGSAHDFAAVVHEALGTAAIFAALAHWWRKRPAR